MLEPEATSPILSQLQPGLPLSPTPFNCPPQLRRSSTNSVFEPAPEHETPKGDPSPILLPLSPLDVPQPLRETLRETPKGDPSPILSPLSPCPVFEPLPFELGSGRRETADPELDGDELEPEERAEFHDIPVKESWACVTQYIPPHSARSNSNEVGCGDAPRARGGGDSRSQISHTRKAWQQRRQRAAVRGGEDEAQCSIVAHDSWITNPRNESICRISEVTVVAEVVARRNDEGEPCIDALFPFPEQQADANGQPIWQVVCQRLPAFA